MAGGERGGKRISRAVSPQDLTDLLERATHAAIAFAGDAGAIDAAPVAFAYRDSCYFLSTGQAGPQLADGQQVSLLVDEGCYHTELRGVRVRGPVRAVDSGGGNVPAGPRWFELLPQKAIAWDYGAMREVPR